MERKTKKYGEERLGKKETKHRDMEDWAMTCPTAHAQNTAHEVKKNRIDVLQTFGQTLW